MSGSSLLETVTSAISAYGPTIEKVLQDPALPQVMDRVKKLADLESASSPAANTATASNTKVGIGLHRVIRPLDAYVYYRKNTWVLPVAAAGAFFVPLLLGLGIGLLAGGKDTCKRPQ